MPSKADVFERVREVLRAEFELDAGAIQPSSRLVDDLDLDSVDAVALMVRLEEETGLALPEEDLRSLATVQHVVDWVSARLERA